MEFDIWKEDQKRSWFQRNWHLCVAGVVTVVVFAVVWLALSAFVFESRAYPAMWLRWRVGLESHPVVDASASFSTELTTSAQWQGEWDEVPSFWGAWDSGSGELQALPEEYLRLPLPRTAGQYVFIGGSLPWRGLDVVVGVPNANRAELISEYWDGRGWKKSGSDGTRRYGITLEHSGRVGFGDATWQSRALVVEGRAMQAYWIRFSVTEALSEDLEASVKIIHDAPTLLVGGWELRAHRRSACENRPGLKVIRVTVMDADGQPLRGVKIGFDVEPSKGVVYDHPDFWGATDEVGYVAWDHPGVPTHYRLWLEDTLVVQNIRTDFGYEYCRPPGTTLGGWRPINRPGIISWDLELRRLGN